MENRKLSRRDFLRLAALTTASAVLAGCGPATSPAAVDSENAAEEVNPEPAVKDPVEIVFVTTGDSDSSEELYKPLYEAFSEAHPEISVTFLGVVPDGGWSGYFDKLAVMVAGGEAPDIGKIPTEGGRLMAAKRITTPLDGLIEASPELDDYFEDVSPKLAEVFVYQGKTYGLPYAYNNMMVWFNTKRLEEEGLDVPPADWTFSDFLTYAQALTKKDGDRTTHYGCSFWTSAFGLCPWLMNNGLEGMMGGPALDQPLMTDPAFVEVIQYLHDLIYKHEVAPRMDATETGSFESGTIGMTLAGRWPISGFLESGFEDYEVQYWPKGTRQVTEVGCGSWPIFSASDHKEEAWEWEKWLLQRESIAYFVSKGANIPSRRSIGYSDEFVALPKNSGRLWYESIDRDDVPVLSVTSPPDFNEMENISGRYLSQIFADELNIEEGLTAFQEEIQNMVERRPASWHEVF